MENNTPKKRGRPRLSDAEKLERSTPAKRNTTAPARGRGGTRNFPNAKIEVTDENRAIVTKLLGETLTAYSMPRVKNDEELSERLGQYFTACATNAIIPTVEEMSLYTGFSSSYLWDIEVGRRNGFSPQTKEIISAAKEFMKAFDAKLVVAGKQNPVVYFFRAKNFYGMRDQQDIVVAPINDIQHETPETIEAKYAELPMED